MLTNRILFLRIIGMSCLGASLFIILLKIDSQTALSHWLQNSSALFTGTLLPNCEQVSFTDNLESEIFRRKAEIGITELLYAIIGEIQKIQNSMKISSNSSEIHIFMKSLMSLQEQQRAVWADILKIGTERKLYEWRKSEMEKLTGVVQNYIENSQNPTNCSKAKTLVCKLNNPCGFACQIHHVAACLSIAIGTGRVLILNSENWQYSTKGWEYYFQPLSNTCRNISVKNLKSVENWTDEISQKSVKAVFLPIWDFFGDKPNKPKHMPLVIPELFSSKLTKLHGDPAVWWIGQLEKYLLRPQPQLIAEFEADLNKLDFRHPIVGVHVRRTDKVGTEAEFHPIENYVKSAEDFYKRQEVLEGKEISERRIYLLTDEPSLFEEAKQKFPHYIFIGNQEASINASVKTRFSDESLRGLLSGIHFITQTDFLVCTFSSNVGRLAYELMLTHHPDSSNSVRSLDDIYKFEWPNPLFQFAILSHSSSSAEEIKLDVGDILLIDKNNWNGWSRGTNTKTGKTGLYPSYKAAYQHRIVQFPPFIPNKHQISNELWLTTISSSIAFNDSSSLKLR